MPNEDVRSILIGYNGEVIEWLSGLISRGIDPKPPFPPPPPIELEDLSRLRDIMQKYDEIFRGLR